MAQSSSRIPVNAEDAPDRGGPKLLAYPSSQPIADLGVTSHARSGISVNRTPAALTIQPASLTLP